MQSDKQALATITSGVAPRGLRIPQAAAYIGVTPWFLEIAIRERRIPALRLGRAYTLLKEDLDSFLDSERQRLLKKAEFA